MSASDITEIVVVSGKGGTGKTTVSASLAFTSRDAVVSDCDVDAANMALLLKGTVVQTNEFQGMHKARIDPQKCDACGICEESCRFDAIRAPQIDSILCEGCGLCSRLCPRQAIEMHAEACGYWFVSNTVRGPMVHARLEPGGDNSGMLVTAVRDTARQICLSEGRSLIVTDGPPGIGCPVISSLTGADLALIVTEPTLSGVHDLERVLQLCRRLDVPAAVCINKFDLNEEMTKRIQTEVGPNIPIVGLIPYDEAVPRAMADGLPVLAIGGPAANAITEMWVGIQEMLRRPGFPSRRPVIDGR